MEKSYFNACFFLLQGDFDENDEDSEEELDGETDVSMRTVQRKKKTERDIELALGDDYILDLKKNYILPDEEK